MSLKVAFIGFRHGHINGLYTLLKEREDATVVGACEEDEETRAALEGGPIIVTHDSYRAMLDEVDCDVVACGDFYAIRGRRLIEAMERGCHVIGDKPLCTDLADLDTIAALSEKKGLRVGCMLDLSAMAPFRTLSHLVDEGAIGEIHTITFLGQHPLNYGQRPMWYFEEGKHRGTLNDLAIHAFDYIPALTGQDIVEVTAARAWNARLKQHPDFQDGAQVMLKLANGAGVMGDVSYLNPEGHGYSLPCYWRFTVHGAEGLIETSATASTVNLWRKGTEAVEEIPLRDSMAGDYLECFLADLAGTPSAEGLNTGRVLRSARVSLIAQRAADTGEFPCSV
jgi:predicted dehydrogenase